MLPSRRKDNSRLKRKPRSEWKKRPSPSKDKEVPLSMKALSLMTAELPSSQADQEDPEALVLEPLEAAPREDLQRRSSERELLR